jgi:hypothetical protein
MIKTQPVTVTDLYTKTQPSTTPNPLPDLESLDTPTVPAFTELLAEYNASISKPETAWNCLISDEPTDPFAIYQQNLAQARPQPVHWLWRNRLPLAGITLLDGDHGCGKSLLALQIAAHVSSGTRMPDGTPTIPGGVVIVTPHTDATTTQLQLLTALGADLSRIEILSYVPEPDEDASTSSHRPFSLPEDMGRLLEAIKRVDARLILLDPFISLLSHHNRWTDQRLSHLLANLNQRLIECNVACIITRNCHAKGGHARPSALERSEHFSTIAVSRLLLAPNPLHLDQPLLSHVLNRHVPLALAPTCSLQIQPLPDHHDLPHITFHGYHSLRARDFIEYRSDTLHRRLLSQHLLRTIIEATDPIHISTLYALFPHCSAFQIHRSLSDLLRTDQIERPARGFYAKIPANPTLPLDRTATTRPTTNLNAPATITSTTRPTKNLNAPATKTPTPNPTKNLNAPATKTPTPNPTKNLNTPATKTPTPNPTKNLNTPAATTSKPNPTKNLDALATRTPTPESAKNLNTPATRITDPEPAGHVNAPATITPSTKPTTGLNTPAATVSKPKPTKNLNTPAHELRNEFEVTQEMGCE